MCHLRFFFCRGFWKVVEFEIKTSVSLQAGGFEKLISDRNRLGHVSVGPVASPLYYFKGLPSRNSLVQTDVKLSPYYLDKGLWTSCKRCGTNNPVHFFHVGLSDRTSTKNQYSYRIIIYTTYLPPQKSCGRW